MQNVTANDENHIYTGAEVFEQTRDEDVLKLTMPNVSPQKAAKGYKAGWRRKVTFEFRYLSDGSRSRVRVEKWTLGVFREGSPNIETESTRHNDPTRHGFFPAGGVK